MKKQYTIKDPTTQATKRQLWFLHILTGENTRTWNLTKGEAAKKIADLKKNGKKPQPAPVPINPPKPAKANRKKPAPAPKTPPKASEKPKAARKQGRAGNQPAKPANGEKEPAIEKPKKVSTEELGRMGAVIL